MYTKDGQTISGKRIIIDGCVVLNPTEQQLQEQGWEKVVPHQPTAEELAEQERQARIAELKELLAQGDYKIIKCAEAQIVGAEMPYDIAALVAERNAYRAEINELEGE